MSGALTHTSLSFRQPAVARQLSAMAKTQATASWFDSGGAAFGVTTRRQRVSGSSFELIFPDRSALLKAWWLTN